VLTLDLPADFLKSRDQPRDNLRDPFAVGRPKNRRV